MITWITVRHEVTGGETQIPETALAGYRNRGWHPPAEFEAAKPAETHQRDDESADHITEETL